MHECARAAPLQQMVARLDADGGATLVVVRDVGCAYLVVHHYE